MSPRRGGSGHYPPAVRRLPALDAIGGLLVIFLSAALGYFMKRRLIGTAR